jgi:hypothetical protein
LIGPFYTYYGVFRRISAFLTVVQVVASIRYLRPEKAGVGGSIPSLATIISNHLEPFQRNLPPAIHA